MKIDVKNKAINLRRSGHSLNDISRILGVSKGSASLWTKGIYSDVPIKRKKPDFAKCATGLKLHHEKRITSLQDQGYEWAKQDGMFRVICALYWGEGKKRNSICVANSDPAMIRLIARWFLSQKFDITFTVCYHEDNEISEEDIKSWWKEKIPELEDKNFRKFSIKNTKGIKRRVVGKVPYGTGYIAILRGSTLLHKIVGGIRYLQEMV